MDIAQLKTLIHVAELGSLSKAADRLHIAQPALSRQIRLLEKELGVYLFDRHGRGMLVTDAGRDVLEHATRIMAELEAIRTSVKTTGASFRGMVTIGITPTVAEIMTVPLARAIREAHPELTVRFTSAFSGHLLDWLQRGEVDLAVSYDPEPLRSLRIVPVMVENLLLVGGQSDGLSLEKPVPFRSLAQHGLVLPSPRHGLRAIVENCAKKIGIDLRASVEADSLSAMIDLVRNGFGLTILPLAPIYSLVRSETLTAAPIIDPSPTRKLVLAFPADRSVTTATRYVGDTFVQIARQLVESKIWDGEMLGPSSP